VRIDRLEIEAFGQLVGWRAENLSGQPLLVVHGANESGKTTLREFLATVLYGFSPGERGEHPYAPWNGEAPGGSAVLRLLDGSSFSLERRLRGAPEGRLTGSDGVAAALGNRPLPATGPVGRATFDDVHAARRDAPDGLREATWALVRERLLGGTAAPHLRSTREAAAGLDARAAELWQGSRRARTRHRRLALQTRRLQRTRDRAAAELRRMLELREQMAGKAWHLRGMQEQLAETRARLLRAERLLPVLRGLAAVEDLRRRAAAAVAQDDFESDARAWLTALRADARAAAERSAALATEIATHEQRTVLSLQDQAVLAAEDEIRTLVGEGAVHQQDLVHVNDLVRERDAQEALFRERCSNVFSAELDGSRRETLARLGLVELRARVSAWVDASGGPELAREELRQAKEYVRTCELDFEAIPSSDAERKLKQREETLRVLQAREDAWQALKKDVDAAKAALEAAAKRLRKPKSSTSQAAGLFVAAGSTLMTLAFGAGDAWWFVVPMAAGIGWFGWRTLRHRVETPVLSDEARAASTRLECLKLREQLGLHEFETVAGHLEKARESLAHVAARPELERRLVQARQRADDAARRVAQREQELDKLRQRVAETLSALPLLESRLQQPGQDLLHDIEELRATLREMTRLTGEQQAVALRAKEREARATRLAERLESAPSGRSPMEASAIWHERLQLALAARRRAEESGRVLPTLRDKGRELEAALRVAQESQRGGEQRLARLAGDGRPESGLNVLEEARAWRAQAVAAEAALRCQFPDWQERAAEAGDAGNRGETLDLTSEQRVALNDQIGQLETGMARLREELDALARERDELAARRPLSDVDGELAALHDERRRVEGRHDRLAALSGLLRLADERWRERWQAPVLATASAHLSTLTGGLWERLTVETSGGETRLFVKRRDAETLHALAEPLSRALRSQAWLALRVALAEQLDGNEPLPLVLDDPCGDWDAARVANAAGLLAAVGTRRQVVLLTGQESVANLFESQVKALVLRLPAAPVAPPTPDPTAPATTRVRRKDDARREGSHKDEPRPEDAQKP